MIADKLILQDYTTAQVTQLKRVAEEYNNADSKLIVSNMIRYGIVLGMQRGKKYELYKYCPNSDKFVRNY